MIVVIIYIYFHSLCGRLHQTLYIYYLIYSNQKAYEAAHIIISFFQQREYGKLQDCYHFRMPYLLSH